MYEFLKFTQVLYETPELPLSPLHTGGSWLVLTMIIIYNPLNMLRTFFFIVKIDPSLNSTQLVYPLFKRQNNRCVWKLYVCTVRTVRMPTSRCVRRSSYVLLERGDDRRSSLNVRRSDLSTADFCMACYVRHSKKTLKTHVYPNYMCARRNADAVSYKKLKKGKIQS